MTGPGLTIKVLATIYMITLRNKFYVLQEISETLIPNDKYENFVHAFIEVSRIPTKLRAKYRFPWETLALRKK